MAFVRFCRNVNAFFHELEDIVNSPSMSRTTNDQLRTICQVFLYN